MEVCVPGGFLFDPSNVSLEMFARPMAHARTTLHQDILPRFEETEEGSVLKARLLASEPKEGTVAAPAPAPAIAEVEECVCTMPPLTQERAALVLRTALSRHGRCLQPSQRAVLEAVAVSDDALVDTPSAARSVSNNGDDTSGTALHVQLLAALAVEWPADMPPPPTITISYSFFGTGSPQAFCQFS